MKVTSALRARSLPCTVMLFVSVICVSARIVPMKVLPEFFSHAESTFQRRRRLPDLRWRRREGVYDSSSAIPPP
jgi:hypothetical protein